MVAQMVKCLCTMRETRVRSLGWEDPLGKEMAPHSSTLAWRIPCREEPGRLQSIGLQRVGHDWVTSFSLSWVCEMALVWVLFSCRECVLSSSWISEGRSSVSYPFPPSQCCLTACHEILAFTAWGRSVKKNFMYIPSWGELWKVFKH